MNPPPRVVTLVLVDARGTGLGRLPSFPVETPWWQDVGPVVRAAGERFGLDVTILRLLETVPSVAHGGAVVYLAQVDPAIVGLGPTTATVAAPSIELGPWTGALDDDPHRRSYARPGGPAADLAWADAILDELGTPRTAAAEQIRTWNLSSLWRLPCAQSAAWLKVVPPFFAHEGPLLQRLAGESVPAVLGVDGARMVLAEVAGEDRHDAPLPELLQMVDLLVSLQRPWFGRIDELLVLGLPDWRGPRLASAIAALIERSGAALRPDDRVELDAFVAALPARLAAIDGCGLPEGLVHGDFHPGNVLGRPGHLVLLDWGDAGIGHPLLDQPAFLTRVDRAAIEPVRRHWHASWRRVAPGCDPDRAARLLAPIAAARQALIYRHFLDNIEASEQVYHRADVGDWLERTAQALRIERTGAPRST